MYQLWLRIYWMHSSFLRVDLRVRKGITERIWAQCWYRIRDSLRWVLKRSVMSKDMGALRMEWLVLLSWSPKSQQGNLTFPRQLYPDEPEQVRCGVRSGAGTGAIEQCILGSIALQGDHLPGAVYLPLCTLFRGIFSLCSFSYIPAVSRNYTMHLFKGHSLVVLLYSWSYATITTINFRTFSSLPPPTHWQLFSFPQPLATIYLLSASVDVDLPVLNIS